MLGALALIATGGAGFAGAVLRLLKPLWPFVVVVGVWHAWTGDLPGGIVILLRLATAVILANSITMTTSLSEMIAVFQWLARPFAVVGLSPRRLALALALAVRFIPVMLDHLARITEAWAARSPRRPRWRVVVPATLAALDDAERAAEALRARGGAD
jgi:biotin transport system permease protein